MKILSGSGYLVLEYNESEWPWKDKSSRDALKHKAQLLAEERGAPGVAIFVKADPLFSSMPTARERVFMYTFPVPASALFELSVRELIGEYVDGGKLTFTECEAIIRRVIR